MCSSQSLSVVGNVLLIRRSTCLSLDKMVIPLEKVEYVRKGFTYKWIDYFLMLITVGLWYLLLLYCADSAITIGLYSGHLEVVRVPKSEASAVFKQVLAVVAPNFQLDNERQTQMV